MIHNCQASELLDKFDSCDMVFMDPPDNIGLNYGEYQDNLPNFQYYDWLGWLLWRATEISKCVWISYYWQHDIELKHRVCLLLRKRPTWKAKTVLWRFTFGQYTEKDFSSGFRYLLRLTSLAWEFQPDSKIRVPSARMELGDARASGLRVPDDVWDIPRVTGNSKERREWHPTQHPEALMKRVILSSTKPGDLVLDPFMGTGTTLRVCLAEGRRCETGDIDSEYCQRVEKEVYGSQ